MNKLRILKDLIHNTNNIVFFGGAGVSTESGIPDFRSPDGLYSQKYRFPPETMLSHDFFINNTAEFYEFYRDKMIYSNVKPNKAHLKLAKLEQCGKLKAVITQNIDGLHQMAGSEKVLELHGSVNRNNCMVCGKPYDIKMITEIEGVPLCSCSGVIKPDVVLYGEGLDNAVVTEAIRFISNADMLIIGGTSLNVYPAAGLLNYYKGDKLVLINKATTSFDKHADLIINDAIGEVLGSIQT
ncbi:MAG: NAD-dependent protein deacylase [Defluviitaleaceae bacterium]|nr:NAD-dependent protein deacylase [Defluviitaleaceae bacterium]